MELELSWNTIPDRHTPDIWLCPHFCATKLGSRQWVQGSGYKVLYLYSIQQID